MVVTVSFGLKNILINSQTVPVIKVAQLIDELVHHFIVEELLVVDEVGLFLNNIIEAEPIRKVEFCVDLWLDSLRCLSVQKLVDFFSLG